MTVRKWAHPKSRLKRYFPGRAGHHEMIIMYGLEEDIQEAVAGLEESQQMTVGLALANVMMETQEAIQGYVEGGEFEDKYGNIHEPDIDTRIDVLMDTVAYGLTAFQSAYDGRDELALLGDKRDTIRDQLSTSIELTYKLAAASDLFGDYIQEKLGDLPDDTPKDEVIARAKSTMGDFVDRLGGMDEIKQPLEQLMELYLRMIDQ